MLPPLLMLKVQYYLNTMDEPAIERFIEEVGVMLELEAGTPRMVGRVLGWLLVCDPPEQSARELAGRLQASKSSISMATRLLLRVGYIDRVRFRGERFDRFQARPESWETLFWREEQFSGPRRVIRLGLDALADEPPARRARLEELDAIFAWWQERIGTLREEYLAERGRAREGTERRKR
jgi:hypothetical protein